MRRFITISAIVLVLLGIGVGAYFYFFPKSASVTVAPSGSVSLPTAGLSGTAATTGGVGATTSSTATTSAPVAVSTRLVQISAGPVVPGEVVINTKQATASSTAEAVVHYIERESGNVFSYVPSTKILTRINNKTIPGIQSASWLPDGSTAFVRYLSGSDFSTINTYALAATSSQGFFLPQNISDLAVSSSGILSLVSGVNGSVVSLSRTNGSQSSNIFTTPLTALRISFAGKNQYLAFSKPSATLAGAAFIADAKWNLSRIAGPLPGLVALASPQGKWVLISYTDKSTMRMGLIQIATGDTIPLPVATIADKCVWTADESAIYCGVPTNPQAAAYPDVWYQGVTHFSDRIWKINVTGRYAQLALDFSQANKGPLDATALAIDPANTTLVFVNKNDNSLWSYSL